MDEYSYNLALKYLARRPRSEKEVHDYLIKKKVPDTQIQLILSKLREQKLINDEEFAQWWVEQRNRFRPKGHRAIAFELKQKGIPAHIISNLEPGTKNEEQLAKELIQKNIKKYQGLSRQELYNKLGGFLARRGFDYDTITSCIDEVLGK